ncbi:N/A [soil metagenome]
MKKYLCLLSLGLVHSISAAVPAVDVVVYGGVPSGIAASIAASREGAKVVLIEPTKHVGGLSTSGLNTAETEHMLKWTFGGIAMEFYERLGKQYGTGKPEYYFESSVAEKAYHDMLQEAGVEVRFGLRVEKVIKDGTKIRSIALSDGSTVEAKTFIDASYEGDLMARAGVSYAVGREAVTEFNEDGAGVRFEKTPRKAATVDDAGKLLPGISGWARDFTEGAAHRGTMNYNWRLTFAKAPEKRVTIPEPKNYDRARYKLLENWLREKAGRNEKVELRDILDLYPRRNGKIEVNNKQAAVISIGHFGGQFDYPDGDYASRDRIIADHTDYTLGLLHFLANDVSVPETLRAEMREYGLHKDEFADNGNWPYQIYVREARRMRGEFVVTQKDVIDDRRKPDSIAMGSHFIDSHHVQRLAVSPTEFINEGRLWRVGWAYQIPYRALTPKAAECTNLLVPGAASYTHVAFCTLRLESTWMMVGHAAGVAAVMAAKSDKPVQQIDVTALQVKLREQKQVIDFIEGKPEMFEEGKSEKEF